MDFTARVVVNDEEPYAAARVRDEHSLLSDEPDWLPVGAGADDHPAPVDYLLSSLAFCQASVLQQTLESNGVEEYSIECEASIDEYGMRDDHPEELPHHTAGLVEHISVKMDLETTAAYEDTAEHCLTLFDDGCIVGNSLGEGIDHTTLTTLEVVQ